MSVRVRRARFYCLLRLCLLGGSAFLALGSGAGAQVKLPELEVVGTKQKAKTGRAHAAAAPAGAAQTSVATVKTTPSTLRAAIFTRPSAPHRQSSVIARLTRFREAPTHRWRESSCRPQPTITKFPH